MQTDSIGNYTPYLPKFIIGGGMKCGTTSLHFILNHHPKIFIPQEEPHFFTIDDFEQNPDFFLRLSDGWHFWDFDKNLTECFPWYVNFFKPAHPDQIIGEDCVSYLSSSKAPARIASILPDVKLIFLLRDPVQRTYSQYWHWVKTNRAIYSFEETLQFSPGHLLQRSLYKNHMEEYLKYFSSSQIKVVIFEDFIQNTQLVIDEVCKFIGLQESIKIDKLKTHTNQALVPRNYLLQLFVNTVLKTRISGRKYLSYHLPNSNQRLHPKTLSNVNLILQKVNFTQKKPYPSMNTDTRYFLEQYFSKENQGLSDLIKIPVEDHWKYMSTSADLGELLC
jgi:hypothetical protein